ncbi:MAG: translation initiation factor IF-3 [Candidatus Paceibacterota bacterium]
MKEYKVNNKIRAEKVRVIDENGENIGVKTLDEAISLAKDKDLDLIEIAPEAKPTVVKIYNFDKFRYQQEKEEKKRKKKQKAKEMKRIRITARMAENDLNVKMKKVTEFLEGGHRVEINLFLRGREKANKSWALDKLNDFIESIPVDYNLASKPKYSGRGYTAHVTKE